MQTVKSLGEAPGCRVAAYGNALITVFSSSGQMEQLDLIDRGHRHMVNEHGKFINVLVVGQARLEAPSTEFRDAAAQLEQRYQNDILCSVIVITASGLAAVMTRTFLVGYNLVVKRKTPMQVFRDLEAAVAWIEKTTQAPDGLLPATQAFIAQK